MMRTEILADRARPILTQVARFGQTITYGQLAALITRPDEPLLDTRVMGKVLDKIAKADVEEPVDLTAFVVSHATGEVSKGWRQYGAGSHRSDSAKDTRLASTRHLKGRTYDNVRVLTA